MLVVGWDILELVKMFWLCLRQFMERRHSRNAQKASIEFIGI